MARGNAGAFSSRRRGAIDAPACRLSANIGKEVIETVNPSQTIGVSKGRQALALLGWLALSFAASGTAVFVSTGGWYAGLNKPTWNPPAWVFGPVWSLLYAMMAVAAWLVWREGGWKVQRRALGTFLVQWFFNAVWTPLFFGLHQPGLALADIIILWFAVAATLVLFWRVSKFAGALLMPYLAWVSFAAVLNFAIWRLNP